ncbi:MAG: DUF2799 domain-containing protein [Pseudomonadota bacterium]
MGYGRFIKWGLAVACIAVAAAAGGCASVMDEQSCLAADWATLGERDGAAGETPDKFNQRAKACSGFGVAADLASYDAGRNSGLSAYCTPERGYEEGLSGRRYRGVCPIDLEPAFLEEFDIGAQLYALSGAFDAAVADYEAAVASLESNRYDLQRVRDRYNENTLSDEERAKARDDMRFHRREIERLENDLPILEAQIDRARGALDDFRAFLARRG